MTWAELAGTVSDIILKQPHEEEGYERSRGRTRRSVMCYTACVCVCKRWKEGEESVYACLHALPHMIFVSLSA